MCAGQCIYHVLLTLEEMDGEEGAGRVTAALQELSGMMIKPPTLKSSCRLGSGPAHTAAAEAAIRAALQHRQCLAPQE